MLNNLILRFRKIPTSDKRLTAFQDNADWLAWQWSQVSDQTRMEWQRRWPGFVKRLDALVSSSRFR